MPDFCGMDFRVNTWIRGGTTRLKTSGKCFTVAALRKFMGQRMQPPQTSSTHPPPPQNYYNHTFLHLLILIITIHHLIIISFYYYHYYLCCYIYFCKGGGWRVYQKGRERNCIGNFSKLRITFRGVTFIAFFYTALHFFFVP